MRIAYGNFEPIRQTLQSLALARLQPALPIVCSSSDQIAGRPLSGERTRVNIGSVPSQIARRRGSGRQLNVERTPRSVRQEVEFQGLEMAIWLGDPSFRRAVYGGLSAAASPSSSSPESSSTPHFASSSRAAVLRSARRSYRSSLAGAVVMLRWDCVQALISVVLPV